MNLNKQMYSNLWRADMYRLLVLGLNQPNSENLEALKGICTELCSIPENPLHDLISDLLLALNSTQNSLDAEYSNLFLTKTACPPSEGSYHLVERGSILGDVVAFYEAFRVRAHSQCGPPDSIRMELEFMNCLAMKKVYALEHQVTDGTQITEEAEKKFLSDHLGRWVPKFCDKLLEESGHPYYQIMAHLLDKWIEEECRFFKISVVPIPSLLPSACEEDISCAL